MTTSPAWIEFLSNPASYPDTSSVTMKQTHISWVFIGDKKVLKIKKPVDFGFLDFTSLDKRKHFCHEEVRLNKRLCPDIYIGAVPLTKSEKGYEINGAGEPVEWIVLMNRMPEEGMMGDLILQDSISQDDIDAIIDNLVPFYEKAEGGKDIKIFGSIDTVKENTRENFEQTTGFIDKLFSKKLHEHLNSWNESFISQNTELFNRRISGEKIKEGHGDLYSANICFDRKEKKVHIFDCIEFNDRFRNGDIAVDVAFLAMDLDYHGLAWLSRYFISEFVKRTNDQEMQKLIDFYKCYRAVVRGKIGCFTWASEGIPEDIKQGAAVNADRYFRLAGRYAGFGRKPSLYVVFGLSGSGKSTLAQRLAEEKDARVFNSDVVRKEIVAGISSNEKHLEAFGEGIYSKEMSQRTYRAISRLAGKELMIGNSVICDATYSDRIWREDLLNLADAAKADIKFIHCECQEEVVKKRLDNRLKEKDSPSDGRWEIYLQQKKNFAPLNHLQGEILVEVDTAGDVEKIVKTI